MGRLLALLLMSVSVTSARRTLRHGGRLAHGKTHQMTDDADDHPQSNPLDFLIIGAGPAGVQLGSLMEREGIKNYLIVERNEISGSFFVRFPRHRTLISINKIYTGHGNPEFNMRHDWNALLVNDSSKKYANYRAYSDKYWPHADTMVKVSRFQSMQLSD